MNILHVVHLYYPALGGTEKHTRELSIELAKSGHKVSIFTTDALSSEGLFRKTKESSREMIFKDGRLDVCRFHVTNSAFLRLCFKYTWTTCAGLKKLRLLRQDACDFAEALWYTPVTPGLYLRLTELQDINVVNVTPFPLGHCFFVGKISSRAHIPFVVTPRVHISDPISERLFLIKTAVKADAVIALTESEKSFFVQKGIDDDKIFVTGIGVSPELYEKRNSNSFKVKHNIPCDSKIVLFVGRLEKYKGIELLIKSMKIVWSKIPDTYLVILGKSTSYISTIIDFANTEKRIVLLPDAPEEIKIDALFSSNLLILPSIYESFGGVFLEAWLAGKPVIGCAIPAVECVVDDEVNGLLLKSLTTKEMADKITFLLKNESRAKEIGRKGKEKVLKEYTWAIISKKTLKVYKNLC